MEDFVFSWAQDASGRMVHVDSVANGMQCGCICPNCKEPLYATHGKVYAHHFAHHSQTRKATLEICYAVILYKVAEHLIQTHKKIHAPSYYGIFPEQDIEFSEVRVDSHYERSDKQPDVIATGIDGKEYLIEFVCAHVVQHKQPLDYKNLTCLEIDLSRQSLETVEKFLFTSNEDRKWLNNENYFTTIEERYKRAGKSVRIARESECKQCPITHRCVGVCPKNSPTPLIIENDGHRYRLCKTQEYGIALQRFQEEERRKAEQERIMKLPLEERLATLPEKSLMRVAYFSDGSVRINENWSSKKLHVRWYNDSVLEFTINYQGNPSSIAAMYIRYRGYNLKDCIMCEFYRNGYRNGCINDTVDQPNAWQCQSFTVASRLRTITASGFSRWIVEV
jgi:radical SAM protein with 4Fe4S-binding SPASM domain